MRELLQCNLRRKGSNGGKRGWKIEANTGRDKNKKKHRGTCRPYAGLEGLDQVNMKPGLQIDM